jgi:DNA-nicking Smr family endonuclease
MKRGRGSKNEGENDRELWNYVTRGIKAYNPSKLPSFTAKSESRKVTAPKAAPKPVIPHNAPPLPLLPGKGFDRATETKLRRGQLPLEGRLDLHGLTQAEAFAALHRFIQAAVKQEKRTVLVITGKGQRFEGVLRRMVPQWLEEPDLARHIVALTPAQPKDGGSGAFYLRLRKH